MKQAVENFLQKNHVDTLLRDDDIVAVNKPAGMLVLPDRYNRRIPALSVLLKEIHPGLMVVHRIDRDTSGVVLFALNPEAHRKLNEAFEHRQVEKRYHAIVSGTPSSDTWTVDLALKEDPRGHGRMMVDRGRGKEATTDVSVLERFSGFALLEARPRTGRTHQIRVHCAATGTPILADPIYGDGKPFLLSEIKKGYRGKEEERPLLERTALHAASLSFAHPGTGASVELSAPAPKDFEAVLRNLRKYRGIVLPPSPAPTA